MWKCDKEKAKLQLVQYVADPRDGYYNAQFRVWFSDGINKDRRTWSNDAIGTHAGIKALTVLTAWMVKNKYGFCPLIEVECNNDNFIVYPYVKENIYQDIRRLELKLTDLPVCIREAVQTIWKQLQGAYGNDDYLDI